MKISELMQALQEIQAKHGDLPVLVFNSEFGAYGIYPSVWTPDRKYPDEDGLDFAKRLYFAESPSATNSGEDDENRQSR